MGDLQMSSVHFTIFKMSVHLFYRNNKAISNLKGTRPISTTVSCTLGSKFSLRGFQTITLKSLPSVSSLLKLH